MSHRRGLIAASAALALTLLARPARPQSSAPAVQVDDPPPDKALIVFFRKWDYPASAVSYIVREGDARLGELSVGTYFFAAVDPGLHTYTVHAERHDNMQIIVEAGETYYVRFELGMGVILYQPVLAPTDEWQFDAISARLRHSPPLPPLPPLPPASAPSKP